MGHRAFRLRSSILLNGVGRHKAWRTVTYLLPWFPVEGTVPREAFAYLLSLATQRAGCLSHLFRCACLMEGPVPVVDPDGVRLGVCTVVRAPRKHQVRPSVSVQVPGNDRARNGIIRVEPRQSRVRNIPELAVSLVEKHLNLAVPPLPIGLGGERRKRLAEKEEVVLPIAVDVYGGARLRAGRTLLVVLRLPMGRRQIHFLHDRKAGIDFDNPDPGQVTLVIRVDLTSHH